MTTTTSKPGNKQEPGRRERRRAETREKLFRTALDLFARRGFFETTTQDITNAADVGEGTFFNYFPNKQHVLTALFEIQAGRIEAAQRLAETSGVPIGKVLHDLVHDIGKEPGRSPALTRSLIVAFLSSDTARAAVVEMLARARQSLTAIMIVGQKRSEIQTHLKASDLALAYQKRVLGTMFFFSLQDSGNLKADLDATFRAFWKEIAEQH